MNEKSLIFIIGEKHAYLDPIFKSIEKEYSVIHMKNHEEGLQLYNITSFKISIVLLLIDPKNTKQINYIQQLKTINPIPEIIVLSKETCLETIVKSFKKGACDILTLTPHDKNIKNSIKKALNHLHSPEKLKKVIHYTFIQDFYQKNKCLPYHSKEKYKKKDFINIDNIFNSIKPKQEDHTKINQLKQTLKSLSKPYENEIISLCIIEDNIVFLEALTELLNPMFEITTASNKTEITKLLKQNKTFDIILLDIFLPDYNGIDLIKKLQTIQPLTGIIIMTAYKEATLAAKALRKGAIDFLTKPFLKEVLLTIIFKTLQTIYFKNNLKLLKDTITQYIIPESHKIALINHYAKFKIHKNKPFYVKDFFEFFPEYRKYKLDPNIILPTHTIEDGFLLFINQLKETLDKNLKPIYNTSGKSTTTCVPAPFSD